MTDWCPFAQRVPIPGVSGAGPMQGGKPKILHHTTEGGTYGGARSTYLGTRDIPHFTDTFENGVYVAFQHLPLSVAATALVHSGGITNTDNVIQIEHVGFAATSDRWPPGYLAGIARLSRWIESQTGCPPTCGVSFLGAVYGPWAGRLTWDAWHAYAGHLGHCHAPENAHSDPGHLNIAAILPVPVKPQPVVQRKDAPMGKGYVLLGSDGGLFAFGDIAALVNQLGNPSGKITAPHVAVDITFTPSGKGYWVTASDGGVFAYGDAWFDGSMGGQAMNAPVVAFAPGP